MTDVLAGYRVVELASWTFVPSAGAVLADWGADVIKIEHPETGDPQRGLISSGLVPGDKGVNHFIEQPNRGKRSIGLDTSTPEGLQVLMKLVETADVFLTNLLPESRRRMGVDVEHVRARNPKIIYARGHGYGPKGDAADRGGYDLASYWARGGIGDAYAPHDGGYPPFQRAAFGDLYGGLAIAAGITAALLKRERTGEPSVVDVSLLNAAIWQLGMDIVGAGVLGADLPKFPLTQMPNPAVNLYRTRDGRYLAFVLLQGDRFWADFCTRLGRPDLITDERYVDSAARFVNREQCITELREIFAAQDLAHWEKAFEGFDGVWDVVRTAREVHDDPQVIANGYLPRTVDANDNEFALAASPVQFDETPLRLTRAPGHGEHTDDLLGELGYPPDDIIDLKVKNVVL
ncbi:coA-transferase III family protein [Mycolicibacterium hassiacum DSM 44199]|uniref:CoA-transferase III family protein n=1 Tax=Mycolicibacterium hassiacum (strain DSM 44199 / CIP 105218 / JCM 12690 / 3849) TaxID=1122247 RepID=K5B880_MYCHD|nr:CaiB/BaiF CoA-transferase family protein [Mycolicibacterium hassiacum]EKF23233.1 coA-transferase III family protein [Mycolicibacterium hassiacum DSM 44199]MBX5486377.1 CoA transferase [Mycolicibacterium hassiacum]MDA4087729.1 CoA transferase [Mycolicibacterium hassiacum DSM 44199]PZN23096.1 MAG: CoA transferase [Mycolicibacterium hassiacum]VCT89698.1 Cinnamoyl-CoA:phenyllactate CoA-transferase [Mycolicibacterium hassiacum DSM 44199]